MRTLFILAAIVGLPLTATAQEVVAHGSFEGASDHETSGTAEIVEQEDGYVLQFADDFSFDGAPDPVVGFGQDGYQEETKIEALQSTSGAQTYELPSDFDPTSYNEVYVWCEQFSVPLGVATLEEPAS